MKLLFIVLLLPFTEANSCGSDYLAYHRQVSHAEELIGQERYQEALNIFDTLMNQYDFVFLKHYKIATQLALHLGQKYNAYTYIMRGIASGWTIQDIEKLKYIKTLHKDKESWARVSSSYDSLHQHYLSRINSELQDEVNRMYRRDQWLAIKALTHFGQKGLDRYTEKKFVPQSEIHIARINEIITEYGYPGEKLIGNELWSSVILSHHVSMTAEYSRQDTIYHSMVPQLKRAIQSGEMSPYSYAMIYDWYTAVKSQRAENSFGYINELSPSDIDKANGLRADLGMRSIEVSNQLLEIQEKTGMEFFLEGKVQVNEEMPITNTLTVDE